jgi:hypothetical protein
MLIRYINNELVIVRQTDHMAQVARMAEQWGNAQFPAPDHREETIRAAGLHDNGWRDWEEQPTLLPDTARPRNLGEMERAVHAAFYAAGVERAIAIDAYTGLLVNLHASALYAGVEGWDDEMTPPFPPDANDIQRRFIEERTAQRRQLRAQLSGHPHWAAAAERAPLWAAYLRLRTWDRMSLFLLYDREAEKDYDHVPTTDGETTITLRRVDEHTAAATPWPFSGDEASVPAVVARVPDRPYESDDEFLHVLSAAPTTVEPFRFVRG